MFVVRDVKIVLAPLGATPHMPLLAERDQERSGFYKHVAPRGAKSSLIKGIESPFPTSFVFDPRSL